jgi:hypothetical protein
MLTEEEKRVLVWTITMLRPMTRQPADTINERAAQVLENLLKRLSQEG